jgi:hypothetical protein
MPPITVGPQGDPLGLGPTASYGPPPAPQYPPPGPYGAPLYQPPAGGMGGPGGGYGAPKWWFGGDYMLTFVTPQPMSFPVLTTSAPSQSGLLGASSTLQLINGDDIRYSGFSGFRLNTGFYGDADRRFGFDLSALYTEEGLYRRTYTSITQGLAPADIPLLARPFIDTTTGPTSLVLAAPNLGAGSFTFSTTSQVWGIDPAGIWNLYRSDPCNAVQCSTDVLLGYKFFELSEELLMESQVGLNNFNVIPIFTSGPFGVPVVTGFRIVPIPVPVGGVFTSPPAVVYIADRFRTTNRFNGMFLGLRNELRYGMWSLNTTAKLGFGLMHQVLQIDGTTAFINPRTAVSGSSFGGLYANSSNIGKYDNDEFAVIPELSMNVGINITRQLSAYIGGTVIYVNRVVRPGDQLNPVIDATAVPFSSVYGNSGSVRGQPILFNQNEFFLYGVNFGVQLRY